MEKLTQIEIELKSELLKQEASLKNYQWDDKTDLENAIFGEMDMVETFMQDNELDDGWNRLNYFRDMQHDMVNDYAENNGLN